MSETPDKFKEYIEITRQIADLEQKKSSLKKEMIDIFEGYSTNEFAFEEGTFYRKSRTTYDYSDNMKEMEKRVKQLKKQEENNGTALIKRSIQYVTFIKK